MEFTESYQNTLNFILQLSANTEVRNKISCNRLNEVRSFLEDKIQNFKPSVMLYGIYNAGKSTTLNALLGKSVAVMSDRAETSKVTPYPYDNYILYDTPGVNAPYEHERITMNQFQKCDVIVFVMCNDGSVEDRIVYDKIKEILLSKKPLILVLNIKSPETTNLIDSASEQIKKISENMCSLGISNIEKLYNLVVIDAKVALKAKLEHNDVLLKYSQIESLEERLRDILRTNNRSAVISNTNLYIRKFSRGVRENLLKDDLGKNSKAIEEMIARVTDQKVNTERNMRAECEHCYEDLYDRLVAELRKGNSNVMPLVDECMGRIANTITEIVEKSSNQLCCAFEDFSRSVIGGIDGDIFSDFNRKNNSQKQFTNELADKIEATLKTGVLNNTMEKFAQEATIQICNYIKTSIAKSLMFGKGPVWIAQFAGTVGKFVGPAVSAILAIYDIYKDKASLDEENKKRMQYEIEIPNCVRILIGKIRTELNSKIEEITNYIYGDIICEQKKNLNDSNERMKAVNLALEQLSKIENSLPSEYCLKNL